MHFSLMTTLSVRQKNACFRAVYNPQITISPASLFSANFSGNRVKNHPKPWTFPLKESLRRWRTAVVQQRKNIMRYIVNQCLEFAHGPMIMRSLHVGLMHQEQTLVPGLAVLSAILRIHCVRFAGPSYTHGNSDKWTGLYVCISNELPGIRLHDQVVRVEHPVFFSVVKALRPSKSAL